MAAVREGSRACTSCTVCEARPTETLAEDVVEIQSNNSYFNGFCIHSNSWVEVNNNNFFEPGTIVSMPDMDDLVVPNDGLDEEKNEGLVDALREGKYRICLVNARFDPGSKSTIEASRLQFHCRNQEDAGGGELFSALF